MHDKLRVESEEVVEEASALKETSTCNLLGHIGKTADLQGVTCQKIFQRAYMRAGHSESVARAQFVRFLNGDRTSIPEVVEMYQVRAKKINSTKRNHTGSCIGCKLTENTFPGLVQAYTMLHPEVFTALNHAKKPVRPVIVEADQLFLDLLDSGILDENNEQWSELALEDEPEP